MADYMIRARMIRIALKTAIVVGVLDFTVSFIMVVYYGGVPSIPVFKPIPATGPYFLDNHGHLTEVSRQIFSILMWQDRSVILLWPLAGICFWLLKRQRQRSN
jgi:hypothetical protein